MKGEFYMANSPHRYNGTGMHFDRYIRDVGNKKANKKANKPSKYESITKIHMFEDNRCKYQKSTDNSICLNSKHSKCSKSIYCNDYVRVSKNELKAGIKKIAFYEEQRLKELQIQINKNNKQMEEERKSDEKSKELNKIKIKLIEEIKKRYNYQFEVTNNKIKQAAKSIWANKDKSDIGQLVDAEIRKFSSQLEELALENASDIQKSCSHYNFNGLCKILKDSCLNRFNCLLYKKR